MPRSLDYPNEGDEQVADTPNRDKAPTTSTGTSSTSTKDRSNLKRGQHGRHQVSKKKVFAIHHIGPKGEPLAPKTIIGTFSNQCSCIVREKVPITYSDWRKVPIDIKNTVWGEVKRRFTYPVQGYDEDKCKSHALFIAGKALRNFRSMLNRDYVQKGRTPFEDYNFILANVWEEFVTKMLNEDAKAKSEKFKELAKRNELAHHLGMIGYAGKVEQWRQEEREAAEAGQSNPLMDIDERSRHFLKARQPKKLKEGRTKYNDPKIEEVEKRIFEVTAAEKSRSFEPR